MNASEFKQQLLPLNAKLYQVARLLLGNDNDASDVVQDVYLKLWKQRDKLSDVDNMQAYCTAVVRNMCLDRKRAAHLDVVEQPPDELQLAGGEEPTQVIERKQTAQLIKRCIAQLPAQQQQVVRMREFGGCTMREIEQATGLSAVNARVMLSRARKSLRNQLQSILKL